MGRLSELFYRIISNRDACVLIKNFTALGILQFANYIFPLITLPYLARVIGVERFGEIAFASTVTVYFQTIVDYGFLFSAVRDIARCRDDRAAVSMIYSRVMWARLALTAISFILLCVLLLAIPMFHEMKLILLLSFLSVPGHALFPEWMFQGLEKMKYITIFNLLIKTIFTIAVFLFIKEEKDYILQPALISSGFFVSGMLSILVIRNMGIRFHRVKPHDVFTAIKNNTNLFINQLAPNLYNSLSILLLGCFHHSIANGVFDAGNKFINLASNLLNLVSRTFFPFMARKMDKHHIFVRINIVMSLIMGGGLFIFAPTIIGFFFTPDFEPAVNVLRIMAVSLTFLSISNAYSTNYLIIKGYEKETRQITVTASIIGFLSAVPLVYFFSYTGAAVAITASRGITALMSATKVHQIRNN